MRILVTGKRGQVVSSLVERAARFPHIELITVGRPDLDLRNPLSVIRSIVAAKPDMVVSAAAFTMVDHAEEEPELAYAVNVGGAAAVAEAAAWCDAPIIHISTDYVFSGDQADPCREGGRTGPRSIYGLTKLEGERAVIRLNPRHIILRTAWVYSPFGTNFVKTMLRLAENHDTISVVSDQWGNPTSALDIADGVLRVAAQFADNCSGIYHLAGTGDVNWSGFARHIFGVSRAHGGPFAEVSDIRTADYPVRARRPLNSRLCSDKFEAVFGWRPPDWKTSTETVVRRLVRESEVAGTV